MFEARLYEERGADGKTGLHDSSKASLYYYRQSSCSYYRSYWLKKQWTVKSWEEQLLLPNFLVQKETKAWSHSHLLLYQELPLSLARQGRSKELTFLKRKRGNNATYRRMILEELKSKG